MRTILRAGAIALATASTLFAGGVAAQAASAAATTTVTVDPLILTPQEHGHAGSLTITVRNTSDEPLSDPQAVITEPIPDTLDDLTGDSAGGCVNSYEPDGRKAVSCYLGEVAAGATVQFTVNFLSPAAPQAYAQRAPVLGSVEVDGVTATFPALFRSTSGSLRNPRPYVQATTQSLTVTAGDATLTRQADGTFAGSVPVTIRNGNDAPHYEAVVELATPPGLNEWPTLDAGEFCTAGADLPVPDGGQGLRCYLDNGSRRIAENEERTVTWRLTAPGDTPIGELGTATTRVNLSGSAAAQTTSANLDTFTITVAE